MLRFKKDLKKQPAGGWHIIEDGQCLRGDTPEQVEEKLTGYRIRNGRTIGDPHEELIAYWAARRPDLVEQTPADEMQAHNTPSKLAGQVLTWLQAVTQLGPDIETGDSAIELRSSICRDCPFNVALTEQGQLRAEIDRRSFLLRKGREMPGLQFCSHHHFDLRVAVRLRPEFIDPKLYQPVECWAGK